jgi:hypothetical protein
VCQQIGVAIHKANLICFLALRAYDGVYMDLDIMVLRNLEEILDPDRLTLSNVWLDHWKHNIGNRRSYNNCFAAAPSGNPLVEQIVDAIVNNMEKFIGTPSHAKEIADGYSPYPWPVSGIGSFYQVEAEHHDEISWLLCDEFVEMQTMQVENIRAKPAIIHGASHNWKRPRRPFEII